MAGDGETEESATEAITSVDPADAPEIAQDIASEVARTVDAAEQTVTEAIDEAPSEAVETLRTVQDELRGVSEKIGALTARIGALETPKAEAVKTAEDIVPEATPQDPVIEAAKVPETHHKKSEKKVKTHGILPMKKRKK